MEEIKVGPTKEFFISMITKDIQVNKAILDLIDNSIDGAKRTDGVIGKSIHINLKKDKFEIKDNCGGFSIDIAKYYAFRFGRIENQVENKVKYSIGRFGIGMKRTLFKLGKKFSIESRTEKEHFIIEVDVELWKNDKDNWQFKLKELQYDDTVDWTGTNIIVEDLYEDISNIFTHDSTNENKLIDEIGYSYSQLLKDGLEIKLNNRCVNALDIKFINDEHVYPAYRKLTLKEGVNVEIFAGISKGEPNSAGWYIYGNDRLLLLADRSNVTGWGSKEDDLAIPQFHPTYAMFRGVVFMSCDDVRKLPLTTTKVGVDVDSETYKIILYNMKIMMKQVFSIIKDIKSAQGKEIYENNKSEVISRIKEVYYTKEVEKIEFKCDVSVDEENDPISRISFNKPRDQVERIKKQFNFSTNKELGEYIFEYFVDMECID